METSLPVCWQLMSAQLLISVLSCLRDELSGDGSSREPWAVMEAVPVAVVDEAVVLLA